jgi:hypothetical protein
VEIFAALGDRIEREWRAANYDEVELPRVAEHALREAMIDQRVAVADLIRWAITAERLPKQHDIQANFGEPPLTLFASSRFFIEALFWLDGTTVVHGHGFTGAFMVLAGSSIHTRYRFEKKTRVSSSAHIGELQVLGVELLRAGACRPIPANASGDDLTHALFHLERPSVTIVVRTYSDPDNQPQLHFYPPHIGYAFFHIDETQRRRLQIIQMLGALGGEDYERALIELLSGADYLTSVFALETAARLHIDSDERLEPFLDVVRRRHGALADVLPAVLAEARRMEQLRNLRNVTQSPEHRFLLALLLNVPNRKDLLRLVREHTPDRDPIDTVVRWIQEMTTEQAEGSNVLEIDFDETSLAMLRCVIEGLSFEEAKVRFARDYTQEEVEAQSEALEALYHDLHALDRLRPLLR